jgi:hypothetical protein
VQFTGVLIPIVTQLLEQLHQAVAITLTGEGRSKSREHIHVANFAGALSHRCHSVNYLLTHSFPLKRQCVQGCLNPPRPRANVMHLLWRGLFRKIFQQLGQLPKRLFKLVAVKSHEIWMAWDEEWFAAPDT